MSTENSTARELYKKAKRLKVDGDLLANALESLLDRYLANRGTEDEFVTCITPDGPMVEWEAAKLALGRWRERNQ